MEQIQEISKASLHSPDYIDGYIPIASKRAGKFLSFDDDGNPVCEIPKTTFEEAKTATRQAVIEANTAKNDAQISAQNAENAKKIAVEARHNSESAKEDAKIYSENASNSATNALTSATNASNSASMASISAGNAKTSENNARSSKDAAKESEEKSKNYADIARESHSECNGILNAFIFGEMAVESLRFKLDDGRQVIAKAKLVNGVPIFDYDFATVNSENAVRQIRLKAGERIIILKGAIKNGIPMLEYDFE